MLPRLLDAVEGNAWVGTAAIQCESLLSHYKVYRDERHVSW